MLIHFSKCKTGKRFQIFGREKHGLTMEFEAKFNEME